MIAGLGFPWSLVRVFSVIPAGLRDWLYQHVARNRYRIFGKKAECMVPDQAVRNRFIGL